MSYMSSHDLNFLYLVDALYEEGSVSRAAERLQLTQPAVSHALGRLRLKFKDELFIRSGSGMAPTPMGEQMALGARRALELIASEVLTQAGFDPLTSQRSFVVGMTDMGGTVLLPRVVNAMMTTAPGVAIRPVAVRLDEVDDMLVSGAIDAAWGYFQHLGPRLYQQTLFRRSIVGIRKRSAGKPRQIDMATFVGAPYVLATAVSQTNELIASKLMETGHTLNVVLEVPYLLAIPALVAGCDLISTVPLELATLFIQLAEIEVFELPLVLPDIAVKQYWHPRLQGDAAHQWFRALVSDCLSDGEPPHE
jgi:DNA-binding transcriptional LysR family regulator